MEVWPAELVESAKSEKLYECDICWYTNYKNFNYQRHCKSHLAKKNDVTGNIPRSSKSTPCTSTPRKEQASRL